MAPILYYSLYCYTPIYPSQLSRDTIRFYDAAGHWIPTPLERERQRAEQANQRAERLAARLRALGIEPDE